MSWQQDIVNSQVNINRAVFEHNRGGLLKTDPSYKENPDLKYISEQIGEAIKSLTTAQALITTAIHGQYRIGFENIKA